ncbi:substrate-binding periplasmic protein [Alloyangia pacifica]|uniref:substrate-binding periplasmic protein n=1 Tax=Alloyangia pacifica TaxID=311180 RepID=UPI001CD7AB77|nr:ABC transporter substrate-binding protein [Alloyangia pacifica]MCA0995016.1 ABC transporter substrate-binding protein [Alloyangia pacifica]
MTERAMAAMAVLAAGALLAGPAAADFKDELLKTDTIVVGTTGSAPPFSMIGDDGELGGFDVAVMTKLAEDLGVDVEFEQLDWAGLLPGLASDRFDVVSSGVTRTAERLASDDLIMLSPYIINGVAVTKLAANDEIGGWDDVCGKTVGVIRGSAELGLIEASLPEGCLGKVSEYPGWTEMSLDLKNHRIDWIGMDYLGPSYLAAKDELITVLPEVRSPKTQSVAVAPGDAELAEALDKLIATYREDGTLNALVEEYFGQPVDFTQMPADPS